MSFPGHVYVVSGVPRSGTSLVMQLLGAGGITLLDDGSRLPDSNNPKGYFEYQLSLATAVDSSWLLRERVRGKAVKVIYRQLFDLPYDFTYKVIFVERDFGEVTRSMGVMLEAQHGSALNQPQLRRELETELEELGSWLAAQPNIQVQRISHRALIEQTAETVEVIQRHLGVPLNTAAMVAVVDPSLYRQRTGPRREEKG
jgi:hypothetical protein